MIGDKLAHYDILEKIGSGGMGEVYRARDTKLSRDVALKVLPQEMSDDAERRMRFQREATAIAALKHPNIVTIYSVEEAEGRHFLTMELVEGKTLSELIPSDGLPLERYFKIAVPLAEAINSAHAAGITHRDLKPANVMCDAEGRVKVLDFGLAKLLEQTDNEVAEAQTLLQDSDTQEGRVLGTVAYMSPEQAEGKPVDARSDIFALGILLYEMATGQRPFKGDTSLSLLSSILKDTPSTVTDMREHLPVQLGRIIQHCLEKDPRKRFQSALDVANELESLKLEVSSATGSIEAVHPNKPLVSKKVGIGGAIALVVLVTLLIINPFKVEVSQDQSATAAGNKLAIMYFENLAEPDDPKRHGEIMGELLITGLSESEHISVVSSQRLYDILKQLGKEGVKKIDRSTASEIATRAGARWMMQGRILQTEPNFVITSQIVEVATGDVDASQRITGQPGETIFALVDRITQETLSDLAVPAQPGSAPAAQSVAAISTHSEEAYRHYLEGNENTRKFFYQEARESFRKAVASDSTFAMAYYWLSYGMPEDQRLGIQGAVRHISRATASEQLYIRAREAEINGDPQGLLRNLESVLEKHRDDKHALTRLGIYYFFTGNTERAIAFFNQVLVVDPLDEGTYNMLAYAYDKAGDFERAIQALDKYIAIAPDEPNPWDTRGDLYAGKGNLDEAIASYARALAIKPDFADYSSAVKLGQMFVFKGEYENSESEYRKLFASQDPTVRARGRGGLINLLLYRGRIAEALSQLDAAVAVDKMEGASEEIRIRRQTMRALALFNIGEREAAASAIRDRIESAERPIDPDLLNNALWLFELELGEEGRQYIAPIEARVDSLSEFTRRLYGLVRSGQEYTLGNYDAAIDYTEDYLSVGSWFFARRQKARACIAAERWDEAIQVLELMDASYSDSRLEYGLFAARLHYHLGVAYQAKGRNTDAIEQFKRFLSIWDKADPRLKELGDAKQRLALLKQSS